MIGGTTNRDIEMNFSLAALIGPYASPSAWLCRPDTPGPCSGELRAIEQQFAVFSCVCKTCAPMYRQVTLAGLVALMSGKPIPMDAEMGYRDVAEAWKHYLTYDNKGRGVVLIGHSQGTRLLTQLMQREIEGSGAPARHRVSKEISVGSSRLEPHQFDLKLAAHGLRVSKQ
jgi:hypothetical protein